MDMIKAHRIKRIACIENIIELCLKALKLYNFIFFNLSYYIVKV